MRTFLLQFFCLFILCEHGVLYAEQLPMDTLLFRYYEKAANLMGEGEYDSAQHYFDKAFATEGVVKSPVYPILLNEQATLFIFIGEYDKAMDMKKQVLARLPYVEDKEKHISVYNDLGVLYRRQSMTDSAMYYYDKALDVAADYPDKSWIANLSLNVAVLHYNLKRIKEAERYVDQALKYIDQADDANVMLSIWQVRGTIKLKLGKKEEARESLLKAWQMARSEEGSPLWQMRCIPSLMDFYEEEGKADSVNYFMRKGEELAKQLPANSVQVVGFLHTKLDIDFRNGRYKEVLQRMLEMRRARMIEASPTFYQRVADCFHHLGDDRQAFVYMDSAYVGADSLARENMASRMAEFNVKYETQAKEFEIARLQQKQLEKDAFWMKVSLGVLLLIATLTVWILLLTHKRKQLQKEGELNSARKYIEGLENERKRFAKELHDGIANDLLGLQLRMDTLKQPEDVQALTDLVNRIRKNVREISHELMPPEFNHLDLHDILARYLQSLDGNGGVKIAYHAVADVNWQAIHHETAYEIYRIVQELVANVLKYAQASEIEVSLSVADAAHFRLQVADNGKGEIRHDTNHSGIGLRTIEDRIKSISADFIVRSVSGGHEFVILFPRG